MRPKAPKSESPLVVRLREIPAGEGLRLDVDLDLAFSDKALAGSDSAMAKVDLHADVALTKTHEQVLARGTLTGSAMLVCSRCAGQAPVTVMSPFQMLFVPKTDDVADEDSVDDEVELKEDQVDITAYEGEEIDLYDTLREELLLALPYAPLCREDCKGLCPTCGKELNDGPCTCNPQPRADRWAALKNVKL